MAISKVYLNSDVQMDITDTTATQGQVASTAYYYGADGVKKQGSYVVPSAVTQATPTISVNTSTGLITASATQSAGVVSAGTKSATEQLSTEAAQTIYPSTSDQTIASGKYLTGAQTIKGVLLTNLSAGNIKKDVVVKVGDSADDDRIISVTGTYEGGGVTPADEKDVNFIDYDGTILYSYTKAEFANLSALPANPSHTGLTAQGWNWSLSDAKTYVASYGKLWIGQMYITSSGDTEIDILLEDGRTSPYLGIAVNGSVDVDWGDGSTHSTVTGSSLTTQIRTLHEYAAAGHYTIIISRISGTYAFYGDTTYYLLSKNSSTGTQNRVYSRAVQAVRVGNYAYLKNYAFAYCYGLKYITIPSTSQAGSFGSYLCYCCYNLKSCTISDRVSTVSTAMFNSCSSLMYISLSKTVTNVYQASFQSCYSLQSITLNASFLESQSFSSCFSLRNVILPEGLASLYSSTFSGCYSLSNITIPSTVSALSSACLKNDYGLAEIHFKPTSPPTASSSDCFENLPTDCTIYVPYSADHSVLDAYTSANNYPSSSTYTYVEET